MVLTEDIEYLKVKKEIIKNQKTELENLKEQVCQKE